MGTQMLLVLLTIVLLSTILLNTFNVLLNQAGIVYNGMLYLQGQKIADRFFLKIEAELIGDPPVTTFSSIQTTYNNFNTSMSINSVLYSININSNYCDSLGNVSYPDSSYQRVDIVMSCSSVTMDTLYIGTQSNPFSEVFFDIGN
ncbi:MAG: hypothetical protein KAU01_06855 [Candidatus Cloacimonetes bacterium]|nr:hypothetical protein [Candidatus Cloacimonadota bacterium]